MAPGCMQRASEFEKKGGTDECRTNKTVSEVVTVKAIEENRRIVLQFAGSRVPTIAELTFTPHKGNTTFVSITERGWTTEGDALLETIVGNTEGWTLVLSALKALLEHQIILTVVADRFPAGLEKNA